MIPLYHDAQFSFRFAEDRIIPRFHLEGVATGWQVSVFRIDPGTGKRLCLLAMASVGDGGWVDLPEPITGRAGDSFIAVPKPLVSLCPVQPDDLPRLFELQLDLESNRMAVTIPRTGEAFDTHWAKVLGEPAITARAVLLDGEVVGHASCFPADGQDHGGYWIDRACWGRGIASRALDLLLLEVAKRPMVATVATGNGASLRVLQKCGFVVEQSASRPPPSATRSVRRPSSCCARPGVVRATLPPLGSMAVVAPFPEGRNTSPATGYLVLVKRRRVSLEWNAEQQRERNDAADARDSASLSVWRFTSTSGACRRTR